MDISGGVCVVNRVNETPASISASGPEYHEDSAEFAGNKKAIGLQWLEIGCGGWI